MTTKLIELARKIKELADRGIDGEKKSAELKLKRLMDKHGITAEMIEGEEKDWHLYYYMSTFERKLMYQVASHVTDRSYRSYKATGRRAVGFLFTASQQIEFEFKFNVYKKSMNDQFDIFYEAFVNKNSIFAATGSEPKDDVELTQEEWARINRIHAMSRSIEKASINKQLK